MDTHLSVKIAPYVPSAEAIDIVKKTNILLLVGISGAGKDTVSKLLVQQGGYHGITSHTTRSPRINHGQAEQDGVEYHFISMADAERMVADKAFIEVKMYSGNLYGTSLNEIKAAHDTGKIAIAVIEVQGVAEYKALSPEAKAVFLLPPNYETWQQRLKKRYEGFAINEADMQKRMQTAQEELEHALETDYFHFIVNDDLQTTIKEVNEYAHQTTVSNRDDTSREIAQKIATQIAKHR
jgi:guanylate kinase